MDSPGAQTPFALCTQEISTRLECMCMCATLDGLVVQEHAQTLPPHTPTHIMVPHGGLLSQPSLRTPLSCRLLAAVVHGDLDASGVHAMRRRGARTRRPLGQAARDGGPVRFGAHMHIAALIATVASANAVLAEVQTLSVPSCET